jgi:hypothetical protein
MSDGRRTRLADHCITPEWSPWSVSRADVVFRAPNTPPLAAGPIQTASCSPASSVDAFTVECTPPGIATGLAHSPLSAVVGRRRRTSGAETNANSSRVPNSLPRDKRRADATVDL